MACNIDQMPVRAAQTGRVRFWHKLSLVFSRSERRHLPSLEPCALSDHLKRDLGFLDGRR